MSRRGARTLGALLGLAAVCGVAAAHGGSLRDASGQELAVPTWPVPV
ncbi:tryptophan-rich sensory protein, partial [Halobacterium sp. PCN9]|nr:tryptophan-rich sensory protein [Halobacterium bonnevillei]